MKYTTSPIIKAFLPIVALAAVLLILTGCTNATEADAWGWIHQNTVGKLDANGNAIIHVDDPVNDTDAATKGYVDAEIDAIPPDVSEVKTLVLMANTSANYIGGKATSLVFTFEKNSYYIFDIYASVNTSATTTGFGLKMVADGTHAGDSPNVYGLTFVNSLDSAGAITGGYTSTNSTFGGYSAGFPTTTLKHSVIGKGYMIAGANSYGTITFYFASEVAGSNITLNAGTTIIVRKVY